MFTNLINFIKSVQYYHYQHNQGRKNFLNPQTFLLAPPQLISSPNPLAPGHHRLLSCKLSVSTALPLLGVYVDGMVHSALSSLLFRRTAFELSSPCVLVGISSLWVFHFSLLSSSICIYLNLFIHSPLESHSDYFQFLGIGNQAALDIYVRYCV